MLETKTLDRVLAIDAELQQLHRRRERITAERDALVDGLMSVMESAEVTRHQTPQHDVTMVRGEVHVDWQRAFRSVASPEAVQRVLRSAPRVPELRIRRRQTR